MMEKKNIKTNLPQSVSSKNAADQTVIEEVSEENLTTVQETATKPLSKWTKALHRRTMPKGSLRTPALKTWGTL